VRGKVPADGDCVDGRKGVVGGQEGKEGQQYDCHKQLSGQSRVSVIYYRSKISSR